MLVGASASVVRAAIMGTLALIAQQLGRRSAGLNALSLAACGMTLINPLTLWDVGFQLSVGATLGLILYAEPFQAAFKRGLTGLMSADRAAKLTEVASDAFLLTLAAQVTTLPIIAYYFRQISLISLAANLVVLPVQPAVMILGGLALMFGLIWLPLGQLAAWITWPFTAYTLAFVRFFAGFPGAAIGLGDVALPVVILFYAGLFGLTWLLSQPADQRPGWWSNFVSESLPIGGLAALSVTTLLVWSWNFSLPDAPGQLRVTVLNVGQGDAVLMQTPSGVNVLIDGGPSGGALVRGLAQQLPLFTNRIDVLVMAAPKDENIGGLPDVLTRYQVGRAALTQAASKSSAYQTLLTAINDREIETIDSAHRPIFDLGDGIRLRVLADHETGSILRLEWQSFSLLLPVGLTAKDEAALLEELPDMQAVTALLVADNGSDKSTSEAWVQALNPSIALISVAVGEPPAPETLQTLAARAVLRTDERGAITLITDGQQLWVETEK